ncbi:MAG: tRNA (adenosine(37)-N6)-dimethylallyltransferase MiaA [Desulfohalobiaceae bacterium]
MTGTAGTTNTRILCLVGATGTGKSSAALAIGHRCNGEIINFDSRQVYADVPVVTAQPTPEEQQEMPHHLYGFLRCGASLSAGGFTDLARKVIRGCRSRGRLPILVGGTGLYLRALLRGLAPIPDIPGEVRLRWRHAAEDKGAAALHAVLAEVDPQSARRIAAQDVQRITRALEVHDFTGKTISWWHSQVAPGPGYEALKIGLHLDWDELKGRLERRIEGMLSQGALEEVGRAWDRCPDSSAPLWTGIGCRELLEVVQGRMTLEQARVLWLKNTRSYAKRQMTWFRKDPDIRWFHPGEHRAMAREAVGWCEG